MKIPKILINARISEMNGVMQQIINEYIKDDYSADDYFTGLLTKLTENNNVLSEAIKRDTVVSELAELDGNTDDIYTSLHGLVKGFTYQPTANIAQAGDKVFTLIEKYGLQVKTKSYREKYPLLASLIQDSEMKEYQTAIGKITGCSMRFQQLKEAVEVFNTKQNAYLLKRDDLKNIPSATEVKKQLISIVNKELSTYLNAMYIAKPDVYSTLAKFVANRINECNAAVRNRRNAEQN